MFGTKTNKKKRPCKNKNCTKCYPKNIETDEKVDNIDSVSRIDNEEIVLNDFVEEDIVKNSKSKSKSNKSKKSLNRNNKKITLRTIFNGLGNKTTKRTSSKSNTNVENTSVLKENESLEE